MLCSTAFCPAASRALYARARVSNKKHIFSCAEQRWEHSRLFELALLTKPSKNVPEKAVRKTLFNITTFCFATLCSTSPVQLYARDHKHPQKIAWRRSTQRAKSEARAWSSSNQRAKQSRALRKNCSEKQLQFTMICFAPRRSASLRALVYTGSLSAQGRTQGS